MNLRLFYYPLILSIFFGFIFETSFALDIKRVKRNEANVNQLIEKFFPYEHNVCVIQLELVNDKYFPNFHVPVVAYTRDQILQDCDGKLKDQDGYVFMTSNTTNIEVQMVPLLKCLNRTTLKIKTKYILILDFTEDRTSDEAYGNYFNSLWKSFGIINMAVLPIRDQSTNAELPFIISYNPFFAHRYTNASALIKNTLYQDLRRNLTERFRNMHGYPLRAVLARSPNVGITIENARQVKRLGDNPVFLLKQSLEEYLKTKFDVYEHLNSDVDPDSMDSKFNIPLSEIINGKADHCIHFMFSTISWPRTIQIIQIGFSFKFVLVVPKPRHVESWKLIFYLFQWKVRLGLGLTLIVLSGAYILFVVVLSKTNKLKHNSNMTSEVLTVWKAFISLSINKLPTRHSQRLLVAISLMLGLIFSTVFSAKLLNLIKSRPIEGRIRSLYELQDSKLPIYLTHRAFKTIMDTFENTSLSQLQKNVKHDKTFENDNRLFDPQHLNITDHAVLYADELLYTIVNQPQNRVFFKYFEVLKEPISEPSSVTVFPIGSVYFDVFNELNLKLVAGGFYREWYKVNHQKITERLSSVSSTVVQPTNDHVVSDDEHVPLKYDDLKLAFYILYIGLSMSALCFIKEVCC